MSDRKSYYDDRGNRRRDCCHTTYATTHYDDCPEFGMAARAAMPCVPTADGWCFNHSTAHGPVYCSGEPEILRSVIDGSLTAIHPDGSDADA